MSSKNLNLLKPLTIAFYVHHHGSGHLMRTLQIVDGLKDYPIILMGSGLNKLDHLPAHVSLVHLPLDVEENGDDILPNDKTPSAFHYAPLGVKGIRDRAAAITAVFANSYPLILIVDVSVEVALLARLAGIPTIIMRQHGKRNDLPHRLAYESAALLIAPFSETMYTGDKDEAYQKTFFSGGFSKFDGLKPKTNVDHHQVCIVLGQGGTSLNIEVIRHIAINCLSYTFHIIGLKPEEDSNLSNLIFHGQVQEPASLMVASEIIIGNTGHNTVMEVAALNKRFIGIPESRPFDEQLDKAEAIRDFEGIAIVHPKDLLLVNWLNLLNELQRSKVDWGETIQPNALKGLANAIVTTALKYFPNA